MSGRITNAQKVKALNNTNIPRRKGNSTAFTNRGRKEPLNITMNKLGGDGRHLISRYLHRADGVKGGYSPQFLDLENIKPQNPIDDIPNNILGLEADDISSFVFGTGSSVQRWGDKSGLGNHFDQLVGAEQPIRNPSGFVRADGVDQQLTCINTTVQDTIAAGDYTIIAVVQEVVANTGGIIGGGTAPNNRQLDLVSLSTSEAQVNSRDGVNAGSSIVIASNPGDLSVKRMITTRRLSTQYRLQVDIDVYESLTIGSLGGDFSGAPAWNLFNGVQAGFWNGNIYSIYVYNRNIIDTEIAGVFNFIFP